MHPFKNFWERSLRDGDSGGSGGTGAGDPGTDPMGGEQGVGAGGSNASGSGSNSEGAGSDAGSGAGVGASGSEAPSASASENVGVDAAQSVGTAPGAAPGTAATSNVGTTTSDTTTSQEDNATVSANVSAAPQGFSSVADAVAAAVDENTQETLANATQAANVSTKGTAQVGTANPNNPSISAEDVAIDNATQQAIANLAEQLGVTPNQMNEMLGTGQVSVDANVSGSTATATATANSTDATSETGGTGSTSGAPGQGTPGQGAPSGPTGEATAPGATPGAEAPSATAPGEAPAGTQGSGNTGSTSGTPGGGSADGQAGPQAQSTPQSFANIAGQTSGVTSISDVLAGIAGMVNPIGSAQAQVVDPNTGGVGGGQGQQGQVDEEEKSKTSKGKSFGGVAPSVPSMRTIGVTSGYVEAPPGAPPGQNPIDANIDTALGKMRNVVTPTPPPLPTPGQINAPAVPGVAQIFGEEPGVPTGTKGFRGVASVPAPPAPALPPTGKPQGMVGPPTAVSVPKGFPGGVGVSPESAEATTAKVRDAVAPKTIEQIMNAPPAPVYSRMPPVRGSLLDSIGKNKLGPTSQSGDGTGGPSTPGAQGQAPGVKGQVTAEEEQAPPLSVVPRLPGFGGVSPGPAPAVPSVVPALPLPASITTTQQPTEETMPAATIDKNAPQSFAAALAAAGKTPMGVKDGMQTIGRLREQAQETLGNPNATPQDKAVAKSYLDRTDAIANPAPLDTNSVAPSVQNNQKNQGTAAAIRGNPSVGLIDKAFVGAQVDPENLGTKTNVEASIGKVGSISGLPGVSTVAGLASRAAGKWGGATQGATLGQEDAVAGTPGATAPWGGDDGFGDTRGDNSGFGRIAGLSSGARLADMGLGGVNSFATIGSDPLFVAQDYGLAGDAFSTLGYSLPGEVDDPRIPEAGRRVTNGFLLRRVA